MPPHLTLETLEDNLKVAYYGVIKESKDMNPNCRGFALPSLCFSVLPICRTPEKTNHQYFRNIALQKEKERLRKLELAAAALASTTTTQATTISTTAEITTTTTPPTTATTKIAAPAATTTTTKTTPQPTETTKLASTRVTTPKLPFSNEPHIQTTQENQIHGNHNDYPTTVKPRLKKSQKSRDRKIKKHSSHQNSAGDGISHSAVLKDTEHSSGGSSNNNHNHNHNDDDDFDEKNKRNRRFLSNFWDEHINFENVAEKFRHLRQAMPISHSMIYSPDSNYPPARATSNLRRICRNECELLENELCQKEYAIAKRHPAIGQVLPIEDCFNLPEELNDCSSLGIAIDVDENEDCYWENGSKYRGKAAVSNSGKPCLTWVRLMKEIADYPELAGTNYCR